MSLDYERKSENPQEHRNPRSQGIWTWSLWGILKFHKNWQWFAMACLEKSEEWVRLCCEMCSGCQHCKISPKVTDKIKEGFRHTPWGAARHIRTFKDAAKLTVTSQTCIADWVFEVSAGKEDPVRGKHITDPLVEQSREIQHRDPGSGSLKRRTLKLIGHPLMLMWEGRNNMKIIRSGLEATRLAQSQKGICYLFLACEYSVSGIWQSRRCILSSQRVRL